MGTTRSLKVSRIPESGNPVHGTIKGSCKKKTEKEKRINDLDLSPDFRRLGTKLWNSIFPKIR